MYKKMQGAVLVAIAASIGNLLQGWDNATIAGKTCSCDYFLYLSVDHYQQVFYSINFCLIHRD